MTRSVSHSSDTFNSIADEKTLAMASYDILKSYLKQEQKYYTLQIKSNQLETDSVTISATALSLVIEILEQISQGKTVKIVPIKLELTTSEAADLLNVSRPYFVELLESGQIPFRKVGPRRRVLCEDVMNYKNRIDTQREQTLAELAAQAQELKMGYE
ncbi:DNA-binding protein [Aphanothece hegewaldii CCALA 016]|uniref:DNA-binding protein n=1 Tax=Aphanothece hegewaldii CCALA 016 TaxID=2107694 RepID=A0A2T1LXE5_9CHRO|nr:excisionase family DNA-binding protein [Aphanothece hegewaldii]PSF37057.1 DNA-binding protein [Aphanothece hegewaldii CCALA 016]